MYNNISVFPFVKEIKSKEFLTCKLNECKEKNFRWQVLPKKCGSQEPDPCLMQAGAAIAFDTPAHTAWLCYERTSPGSQWARCHQANSQPVTDDII